MRWLILLHRYLGIGIGWLLVAWCLSGVVMMYVGFPELTRADTARMLPDLALSGCCRLDSAAGGSDIPLDSARVEMLAQQPVLRTTNAFGQRRSIGLLDGEPIEQVSPAEAHTIAAALARDSLPEASGGNEAVDVKLRYLGSIDADQWTVTAQYGEHRPLHHFALQDDAGTEWYISSTTGELVQSTTGAQRFWNWVGSVPHWLYPTLLRQNGPVWIQVVIWTSVVGAFLTLLGLYIGVSRLRRRRNGRLSPYRGVALWHHYLGLVFGVLTLTWLLSGLLSVNPWGLLEGSSARDERENLRGAELTFADVRDWLGVVRTLAEPARPSGLTRLELLPFAGALQVLAYDRNGRVTRLHPESLEPSPLDEALLARAAAQLTPEQSIASAEWLTSGDEFYFSHHAARAFPVYRVITSDANATRYYIDATTGQLLLKADRNRRSYRWLFEGFHRFDFNAALRQRPLWDVLMLTLLAGVTGICATGTYMGIRYLMR